MEIKRYLLWLYWFMMILFISEAEIRYLQCTEFVSPLSIHTVGTSVGVIQLPISGGRYKSNQICEWYLETDTAGYGIRLDVVKSSMQGKDFSGECNNDYVDIFDSHTVFIGRFCGSAQGMSYTSTGNQMVVKFHSDASMEFTGFQAKYQSVLLGPNKDEQEEENKRILNLAIGIPIGLIALFGVIICFIYRFRYWGRRKASTTQPQSANATQNSVATQRILPGGSSRSTDALNMYHDNRVSNIGVNQFPSNVYVQDRSELEFDQGGLRQSRSVTPPPSYNSLIFDSNIIDIPLTPPPYEMVVKEYIGPANH
uniref:CUB domain-containing protein n=1 Tax=Arion vulgaris TaxID=1028688 RepID=A0A0B6ZLI1_9EUPU